MRLRSIAALWGLLLLVTRLVPLCSFLIIFLGSLFQLALILGPCPWHTLLIRLRFLRCRAVPSTVATSHNAGTLSENVAFFRNEMVTRGWKEDSIPGKGKLPAHEGDHRILVFVKGGGEIFDALTSAVAEAEADIEAGMMKDLN